MTRLQLALVGAAAVALVAIGYGFGRSTSTTSSPAIAPDVATPVRASAIPTTAAPTLATPRHPPDRELARDLKDADPRVRTTALRDYLKDPSLDPQVLLAASRDPDLGVAFLAVDELGRQYAAGNVAASELIARATDRSLPEKVRMAALNGVAAVATPETARLLIGMLASADPIERRAAAALLRNQDRELAVPALIGAVADSDDTVRDTAVASLRGFSRGRDFGTDAAAWRGWWQSR